MHIPKRQASSLKSTARAIPCAVAVLVFGLLAEPMDRAWAQSVPDQEIVVAQNGPFRGFNPFAPLQRLFGGERRSKKQPKAQQRRKVSRPAGAPPKFESIAKDPNAGLIVVVGDRMARGVADGLKFMLSDKPHIRVEPVTQDKAGFTGETAPDWATDVLSKIRGGDVKAVVVMIGQRDLSETFPGEPPVEFMTEEWLETYRNKVASLVRVVRQEKKPLVWAGLPPTNNKLINADFTQLNSIFEAEAADRRVRYVDIWDIFLAQDGSYSSFGPNVDGKNARLRTNDRIGFTWDGYRKVAFFVERELLRLLGSYGGLAFEGVEDDPNFIVLTGRTTSPEALLMGGEEETSMDPKSRAYRFFVEGEPLQPMRGRVDNPKMPEVVEVDAEDVPASDVPELRGPLSDASGASQGTGTRVSVTLRPPGQ